MFPWVTVLFVVLAALSCLRRGFNGRWMIGPGIIGLVGLGFLGVAAGGFGSREWFLLPLTTLAAAVIAFVGLSPARDEGAEAHLAAPSRGTGARTVKARHQGHDGDRWTGLGPGSMGPPVAWRELFDSREDPGPKSEGVGELRRSVDLVSHRLSVHQSEVLTDLLDRAGEGTALLADTWEDLMDRPPDLPPRWTEHPARGRARSVSSGQWGIEVRFEGIAPGDASVLAVVCDWTQERWDRAKASAWPEEGEGTGTVVALVPTELPSVKRLSPHSSERARWVSQCTFLPPQNVIQPGPL